MKTTDTIAAVSTALSPSGIGIVRVSGEDAIAIADKVYKGKECLSSAQSHSINYGYAVDSDGITIDRVLVMLMKGPRTFTGEDTVEFDCHGGVRVLSRVLQLLIDNGARLAEPGEFTKRAFLNGKMDLAQAEAVADIISAENDNALSVGMKQLKGNLSEEIKDIRRKLLNEIAFIEAALDDPEHYSLEEYTPELRSACVDISTRIRKLIDSSGKGMIIKSGVNTVIVGRPNAGKSSVYNLLAGRDRAIVTDIAGTTRDTLTENISFKGINLRLTDTAGIRDSSDVVEQIGVERARDAANDADLVLCIIDGSVSLSEEDRKILDYIKNKKALVLLNKTDIMRTVKADDPLLNGYTVIEFSAKTGEGRDLLEETVESMFYDGQIDVNDEIFVTEQRHLALLKDAGKSMELVLSGIENGMSEDLLSVDMTDAYEALGSIIGEAVGEDIINEIFSKFCMGK